MGIFDFLSGNIESRLKGLQKKVTEKYGPPEGRQKAIETLLDLATPASIGVLLNRFTITSEPSITDAEEKTHVFKSIVAMGDKAIEPIIQFLKKSELASSWAIKALRELLPEKDLITLTLQHLDELGNGYTRDPQKKIVLIDSLGGRADERIVPGLIPFLEDPSDEVRIAAARALTLQKDPRSREPLCAALIASTDRARVVAAMAGALADAELPIQGFREKIEQALPQGFFVDGSGTLRRQA